jgi:biopolymer transport protein ExbB/TolQ
MSFIEYASFIELKNIFQIQMSLFEYFGQSNSAGKFILFILLICSILAWSVIIGKLLQIRRLEQMNKRHQMDLNKSNGVIQLNVQELSSQSGPHAKITEVAFEGLCTLCFSCS